MLPETEKQVEGLRSRTNATRTELEQAKKLFGDNKDEFLLSEIRQASYWLEDIETHFIAMLTETHGLPRTPAEELHILSFAEFHLNRVALPRVKTISGWARRYGPKFQSIGF